VANQRTRMIIGIQPTACTNDDFPEIGNDVPYQIILDQTKECQFEGAHRRHGAIFANSLGTELQ
jgi:hypothetical protein